MRHGDACVTANLTWQRMKRAGIPLFLPPCAAKQKNSSFFEIYLDFSRRTCYYIKAVCENSVYMFRTRTTWRSRLVGRGRATGNRVTRNRVREFESLLLRHKRNIKKICSAKTPILSGFFAAQIPGFRDAYLKM